MARKKIINTFKIFPILVITIGVVASVYAVQRFQLGKSYAHDVMTVGSLGTRSFYRTAVVTKTTPAYTRGVGSSQGYYDKISNKTFIVYSAGIKKDGYSAVDPYIVAYDHAKNVWLGPVRLAATGSTSDGHNYPQIVVDNSGYLHVFHTFHGDHTNIMHFKSVNKGDINSWNHNYIQGTNSATYGYAVKDNQGEIYLFYRHNIGKSACSNTSIDWNEGQAYVKSSNNGVNWSSPYVFIKPNCIDNWNTVYMKDIYFEKSTNKLHITFGLHFKHNTNWGNQHYVVMNLDNNYLYSVKGTSYGKTVTRNVNWKIDHPETMYFNAGGKYLTWKWSHSIVVENSKPYLYHTNLESDGITVRLKKAGWNGTTWASSYPGGSTLSTDPFGSIQGVYDGEYRGSLGTDLYVKTMWGGTPVSFCAPPTGSNYQYPIRLYNSSLGWKNLRLFADKPDWECRGISHIGLIPDPHPTTRAVITRPMYGSDGNPTVISADPAGWFNMYPIGVHYVFGESILSQAGSPPYPAPVCTTMSCNGWETTVPSITINNCTYANWTTSPLPSHCQDKVSNKINTQLIINNNPSAYEARYIEVDKSIYCNKVSLTDSKWSNWEDYTKYKYWYFGTVGDKKICVQYRNYCKTTSSVCGAMTKRI